MKKGKKPRLPSRAGMLLARLPAPRWLYPLYLSRQLYLKEDTLCLPALPEALDGLRIAYASDIHYGAYLGRERLTQLADRLNALQADVMILGGDYGENSQTTLDFWRDVPDLQAKLAVCAVMGNHDLSHMNAAGIAKAMRLRGVTPLINGALSLRRNGCRFALCATDDPVMGAPDYARMARQAAGEPFVIYAPHSPDALKDAYAVSEKPFFDLALCGHTHGGQIAFFGFAPRISSLHGLRYGNRYRAGIVREKGVTVLISNGVGASWLPLRLGAPPQYHLITLRKDGSHEKR